MQIRMDNSPKQAKGVPKRNPDTGSRKLNEVHSPTPKKPSPAKVIDLRISPRVSRSNFTFVPE